MKLSYCYKPLSLLLLCIIARVQLLLVSGFGSISRSNWGIVSSSSQKRFFSLQEEDCINYGHEPHDVDNTSSSHTRVLKIPLKYIGPYPCLPLKFPHLATPNQISKNTSGIALDFVLDTAANTNTIHMQVAKELQLIEIGSALPGVGAAGPINGGTTFLLGDCQLEEETMLGKDTGVVKDSHNNSDHTTTPLPIFMSNLTASALPVASPAAAGLLSSAFLNCFPGGVEFQWGNKNKEEAPMLTFYADVEDRDISSKVIRVPIQPLEYTRLPSITLNINGVPIPALLDTGSPITVFNEQAAQLAHVVTTAITTTTNTEKKNSNNPFANMAQRFQDAQATAKAAARGDIVLMAGSNGEQIQLVRSQTNVHVGVFTEDGCSKELGNSPIYIGNVPGLAVLSGFENKDSSTPAAILGMDVLRSTRRMIYCGQTNELFFEI